MNEERPLILEMASRLSRDSLLYAAVTISVFPLALANTAVLTRFLSISQFGQVAIVFFWSAMLTVALNLLILRGTERHIWGSSDDMMDVADGQITEASILPRALGTGLILNIAIAATAAMLVYVNSDYLARTLVHDPALRSAIIWGGISGSLGSVWRLSTGILRWERRRQAFSMVYIGRWVLAIAISWPLLLAGFGASGVLAGTALGTLLTALVALFLARRSFILRFDRQAAKSIIHKDIPLLAMVIGLTILHDADVFLLSIVAKSSQVGVYRLATRLTSIVSYAVSAFLLAWAPLEASSLFRATYQQVGRERVRASFVAYYLLVGTFLVVVLSATAVPLIAVVAPHYGAAAPFVSITAVAYLAYGLLIVVARACDFPRRYLTYGIATLVGAGVMISTCLLLGRPLGGYGVALGDLLGALAGLVILVGASILHRKPPPIDVPRIALILLAGGVCYGVGVPLAGAAGAWRPVLEALAILLYPALVVLTGAIPRDHVHQIRLTLAVGLGARRHREELIARIPDLSSLHERILLLLLRDKEPASRAAQRIGIALYALRTETTRAVRELAQVGVPGPFDEAIGALFLTTPSVTKKNSLERRLEREGLSASELHDLSTAFHALQGAPKKAWAGTYGAPRAKLPPPPWPLERGVLEVVGRVIRDHEPRLLVAALSGISDQELDRQLVGALRVLAGLRGKPPTDRLIASFLFDAVHAPPVHQLWAAGVDPIELHELELVLIAIRNLGSRRWQESLSASSEVSRSEPTRGALLGV